MNRIQNIMIKIGNKAELSLCRIINHAFIRTMLFRKATHIHFFSVSYNIKDKFTIENYYFYNVSFL